jgi:hypothetical protein
MVRGGQRSGAGRPLKWNGEKTSVVRIPAKCKESVLSYCQDFVESGGKSGWPARISDPTPLIKALKLKPNAGGKIKLGIKTYLDSIGIKYP